jgi:hypothetical protein
MRVAGQPVELRCYLDCIYREETVASVKEIVAFAEETVWMKS